MSLLSVMPVATRTDIYRSQVLDRTFQLLDVLSEEAAGLSVTELAERLKLHKSTTHRLIMVLEAQRYIARESISGKYHLGPRIIQLGLAGLTRLDLYEVSRPHIRDLMTESGETAHLGILSDCSITTLLTVEGPRTVRTPSTMGMRHAAHSSSLGKAILAFISEPEAEKFLRENIFEGFTRHTITSPEAFAKELEAIRVAGWSVDDEEAEEGLRCVGAPVRNCSGETVAAISISGPVFRVTRERLPELSVAVMTAAAKISAALGYPSPHSRSKA